MTWAGEQGEHHKGKPDTFLNTWWQDPESCWEQSSYTRQMSLNSSYPVSESLCSFCFPALCLFLSKSKHSLFPQTVILTSKFVICFKNRNTYSLYTMQKGKKWMSLFYSLKQTEHNFCTKIKQLKKIKVFKSASLKFFFSKNHKLQEKRQNLQQSSLFHSQFSEFLWPKTPITHCFPQVSSKTEEETSVLQADL